MTDADSLFFGADNDGVPIRSRSMIAHAELLHSATSNAYHVNKEIILQDLAEKQFPLEDLELIFKPIDEAEDETHFAASYLDGLRYNDVHPSAYCPTVHIVFMPGLDKMAVAQAEEQMMTREQPKQKTCRWRTLTAGTFLVDLQFDDNLALRAVDQTPKITSSMRRKGLQTGSDISSSTALFKVAKEDRLITIDSDNVKIVDTLVPGSADLEATLIEVDKGSLFNLVTDFHRIVRDGGAALNTDLGSRVKLLETMIEDAGRLALRSPILFRASTRRQIARSRNTRYGVDHGTQWETITTSVGIKHIISKSAACFNSLATTGDTNEEQAVIRPKFLQMLVLLLSLLNDDDLSDIKPFLEKTYRIKADRPSIEVLILKVLPLQSINKFIFVRELLETVEQLPQQIPEDEEKAWNRFIMHLVHEGYMLPGFTEQMGQPDKSWLVKFPEGEGFKDTHVFNNLQSCNEHCTLNEIPAFDPGISQSSGEVTCVLTDNNRYLIEITDHRKITGMIYGNYAVAEVGGHQRSCDLSISDVYVNDYLNTAIHKTNHLLSIVNRYFAKVTVKSQLMLKAEKIGKLTKSKPRAMRYPDITSCGRLTTHEAKLNGRMLAIAYKLEGKKVARRDLIRCLVTDTRKVKTMLFYIEDACRRRESKHLSQEARQTIAHLKESIPQIHQLIGFTEQNKAALEQQDKLDVGDEPIVQTIFPGNTAAKGIVYWSSYTARLSHNDSELRIEAARREVRKVNWVSDDIVELWLATPGVISDRGQQFFVSPLQRLKTEQRQWEVRIDDQLLMVGQYIVIVQSEEEFDEYELATPSPTDWQQYENRHPAAYTRSTSGPPWPANDRAGTDDYYSVPRRPVPGRVRPQVFMNWMKIVGVPNSVIDPRLKNRMKKRQNDEYVVH